MYILCLLFVVRGKFHPHASWVSYYDTNHLGFLCVYVQSVWRDKRMAWSVCLPGPPIRKTFASSSSFLFFFFFFCFFFCSSTLIHGGAEAWTTWDISIICHNIRIVKGVTYFAMHLQFVWTDLYTQIYMAIVLSVDIYWLTSSAQLYQLSSTMFQFERTIVQHSEQPIGIAQWCTTFDRGWQKSNRGTITKVTSRRG